MQKMDMTQLGNLGVGGLVAIWVLSVVFKFLNTRAALKNNDVGDIFKSLADIFTNLSTNIGKQTEVLTEIKLNTTVSTEVLRGLTQEVRELKRRLGPVTRGQKG